MLQEKDDDGNKVIPRKQAHQNTMPKVVENDDDNEGEDDSKPLPADNAINKTQMINEVFEQIFNGDAAN